MEMARPSSETSTLRGAAPLTQSARAVLGAPPPAPRLMRHLLASSASTSRSREARSPSKKRVESLSRPLAQHTHTRDRARRERSNGHRSRPTAPRTFYLTRGRKGGAGGDFV